MKILLTRHGQTDWNVQGRIQAKTIGIKRAKDKLNAQVENTNNITDEQINVYENAQFVDVEVIYEVKENIGTKEKIVF